MRTSLVPAGRRFPDVTTESGRAEIRRVVRFAAASGWCKFEAFPSRTVRPPVKNAYKLNGTTSLSEGVKLAALTLAEPFGIRDVARRFRVPVSKANSFLYAWKRRGWIEKCAGAGGWRRNPGFGS